MRNNKILYLIIFLLIVILTFLLIKTLFVNRKLRDNSSIYCVMEDSLGENKMEIYYDFIDGEVYKFSIINTNKMTENVNVDAYKDSMKKLNDKYKGATGKFWTDNNIYITTEIYDLTLLSEYEFKEITSMSKKELKTKTRQDIIDSIIPMGSDGIYKCN